MEADGVGGSQGWVEYMKGGRTMTVSEGLQDREVGPSQVSFLDHGWILARII